MPAILLSSIVFTFINAIGVAVDGGASDTVAALYGLSVAVVAVTLSGLVLPPLADNIFNNTLLFACVAVWGIFLALAPRIIWNLLPLA